MNSRSTPGLRQWLMVTLLVGAAVFILYKIYQYGSFRQYLPAGLTVGGLNVGGMTEDEARSLISSRYEESDVLIFHGEESISVSPGDIEFELDLESMMTEADYQRSQQDFWAGFWGFLWNRPIEVDMVELRARHDADELRRVLATIAGGFDTPAQPPQPIPTTLTFQYGEVGVQTNVDASISDVTAAFYRPSAREAHLTLSPLTPERPDMTLLGRLILNHLQDRAFGGVASVFILDLDSGQEVFIDAGIAMSGMDLVRVPIVLDSFRMIEGGPTATQEEHMTQALLTDEAEAPRALLNVIAGQDNPFLGAQLMTESMWRLGLKNTFIAIPYGEGTVPGGRTSYETPANTAAGQLTLPTGSMQTTAEDMGTLLAMIYTCANGSGGPLLAAYADTIGAEECQQVIDVMTQNQIGSLIEEGVPEGTTVAHRHAWVGDTHGDSGIVFSPGGDYVISMIFFQNDWLPWERSSPLMADISRATYNYFNFDNPFLDTSRAN